MLARLAQEDVVFRASSRFISVDAQAFVEGRALSGLKREDFRVLDNGQAQTIASFGAEDQPLDVLLMLDVSQSTGVIQESIKRSAAEAMAQLLPQDRLGVLLFADDPFILVPLTADRAAVTTGLEKLPQGRGGTELNGNVQQAARYLQQNARVGARRAIVMLSDNQGYPAVGDQAVRDELWRSDVVFNLLLFPGKSSRREADVRQFVKSTGGELLPFREAGVPLAELFARLRQRYSLLYPAPEGKAGEVRQIRVELTSGARRRHPRASVRARTGYVAATP